MKRRGFRFVGSTIIYAYLQAVGIVEDHEVTCGSKPKRRR
jgi:DNA-3-methyladenine glycosylase I